jgi:hypothetical protein
MRTRFRTLLLAGAASLAVSAAVAQVTVNVAVATISQIVKVVWNGQDISAGNPLPVAVVSGGGGSAGSVTAAGANGTTAQAVQGITGGVPVAVSTPRSSFNSDFVSFSVGASATAVGATKSLGTSPSQWAWISFNGSATVTGGTFFLQCSTDSGFASGNATVASVAVATASATPGAATTVPVSMADRVRYPFCRVVYTNGVTAGAISGATALTAN